MPWPSKLCREWSKGQSRSGQVPCNFQWDSVVLDRRHHDWAGCFRRQDNNAVPMPDRSFGTMEISSWPLDTDNTPTLLSPGEVGHDVRYRPALSMSEGSEFVGNGFYHIGIPSSAHLQLCPPFMPLGYSGLTRPNSVVQNEEQCRSPSVAEPPRAWRGSHHCQTWQLKSQICLACNNGRRRPPLGGSATLIDML